MKNYYKYTGLVVLISVVMISCSKKATDYQSFFNGQEIVYPGIISGTKVHSGNKRVLLTWNPNPDPSVTRYVVYWNNYSDSVVLNATSHSATDTVKCTISNLPEYVYSFFIYSFDNEGHRSVITEISNAKVYGSIYQGNLHNRVVNTSNPYVVNADGSVVTLNFLKPDTINITTTIKYTNKSGTVIQKDLLPDNSSVDLSDYKFGTPVTYRSSYIPSKGALDTFYTLTYDTFPVISAVIQCDKSLFKQVSLPNDVYADFGTGMNFLWDGSTTPQPYPNIFHTNGSTLPHHFTFDLGKIYDHLSQVEETGRDGGYHSPDDFEVWGIADITNAATSLPSNDAGWPAESVSKGWTLLKEVKRTDDGIQPFKADLMDNPPQVRYIRIRVKHVASGNTDYSNMSEITFWNKL